MNLQEVIKKMNAYTISATYTHDLAISSSKLMSWDESEWKIKPRLSTGANRKDLSKKELPLCLEMSHEMSSLASLVFPDDGTNQKKYVPILNPDEFIPISRVIATQIILYNYCLLEEYEFNRFHIELSKNISNLSKDKFTLNDFNSRGYDKLFSGVLDREQNSYERRSVRKRINEWNKVNIAELSEKDLACYEKLSIRRNELTHESDPNIPSLEEAIIFFHKCRLVAKSISISFSDPTVGNVLIPYENHNFDE